MEFNCGKFCNYFTFVILGRLGIYFMRGLQVIFSNFFTFLLKTEIRPFENAAGISRKVRVSKSLSLIFGVGFVSDGSVGLCYFFRRGLQVDAGGLETAVADLFLDDGQGQLFVNDVGNGM